MDMLGDYYMKRILYARKNVVTSWQLKVLIIKYVKTSDFMKIDDRVASISKVNHIEKNIARKNK